MNRKLILSAVLMLLVCVITGCKQSADQSSETVATEGTAADDAASGEAADDASATQEATAAPVATPTAVPTEAPAPEVKETSAIPSTAPVMYKDGIYEVQTDPDYENFYTKATVTIEGGAVTDVDWFIYDVKLDQPFDEEYYHVYESVSDVYVKQAKDDWSGSRGYSDVLIETQDVGQVDAVSGATWTNKKFKEIVKLALEKAKN